MPKQNQNLKNILNQIRKTIPFHPGKISRQFNVCGKAKCKCKDPNNPIKHGPYLYLSYTFQGKGKTLFITEKNHQEMEKRINNYKRFKTLIEELIRLNITLAENEVIHDK